MNIEDKHVRIIGSAMHSRCADFIPPDFSPLHFSPPDSRVMFRVIVRFNVRVWVRVSIRVNNYCGMVG